MAAVIQIPMQPVRAERLTATREDIGRDIRVSTQQKWPAYLSVLTAIAFSSVLWVMISWLVSALF